MIAQIAQILKYQQVEAALLKLKQEIENNKDRQNLNLMATVVREAGATAELLEKEAEKTNKEFQEVKKIYETNQQRAEKLANVDVDKTTDEELVKLNEELEKILANLNAVEKRLIVINKKMDELASSYEKAKQNALKARANHAKSKTAYEEFAKVKEAEIDKLVGMLKTLEKTADGVFINKYKKIRQNKVWPAVVAYKDSLCGGCRMQMSITALNKLKTQGCIECEHCGRLLYSEEN